MADIFISHVEEDSALAIDIANQLEAVGYSTWYYERDSVPGQSFNLQTRSAIEGCNGFIIIVSHTSIITHRQISKELHRADETDKPIIPLLHAIKDSEYKKAQPEWEHIIGSSTSLNIENGNVSAIMPRLISGLGKLKIGPVNKDGLSEYIGVKDELVITNRYIDPNKPDEIISSRDSSAILIPDNSSDNTGKWRIKFTRKIAIYFVLIMAISIVVVLIFQKKKPEKFMPQPQHAVIKPSPVDTPKVEPRDTVIKEDTISTDNKKKYTKLLIAEMNKGWNAMNITLVRQYLSEGADINAKNFNGNSLLIYSATRDSVKFAQFLIANGININAQNKQGQTPLQYAARWKSLRIVKLLVINGSDINAAASGLTALHLAAMLDAVEIAKYLVENGANINVKDQNNNTPLDRSTTQAMKQLLISHGAKYGKDLK